MNCTRKTRRFGLLAAVASLSLVAAACGDDEPSADSGATQDSGASQSTDAPQTTEGTAMTEDTGMAGEGPTGPACGSVPKDGEGSFEGMADDPAATAASNNPELETLVAAVTAADLGDTLNGEGPFTIFAPANAAFEPIPEADLTALLEDEPALTNILTFHVVAGEKLSGAQLAENGTAMSVQGGELTFAMEGDSISINDGQATVVCADVPTANATVHIIDGVLMPEA
ncbi:MAG: fasciclin domain-containing protein [Ilumatobacteraceae bacterium]